MATEERQYSDAVTEAVDSGNKIEAIKQLREETGVGLTQAKKEIDGLYRIRHPQAAQTSDPAIKSEEGGAGGLLKLLAVIAVIVAAYLYFF
ncbi:MAG: hypothetical protein R3176_02445 [Woeseiaceae bacterium]|nr:hypothetical protein [Woeseiaceae bacterium]